MADDPELEDLLDSVEAGEKTVNKDDAELSQLLDSALKDFVPSKSAADDAAAASSPTGAAAGASAHVPSTASDAEFPHLEDLLKGFASFNPENAASSQPQPQEMEFLKELMKEDPQMLSQFEQLAQAACHVDESETSQRQFSDSLTSTLTALTQNMESLQSNLSEEEMMAALAGLNFGNPRGNNDADGELRDDISLDGDDDDAEAAASGPSPAFLPMLGGMMKSILSKEVLHPSLQEIANIYPGWLEENKNTLSEEDYVRYEKQYIIISEVCRDFEEETESSTEDDKQKRFERVLLHMQNMHELGQPPKELLLKLDPSMATNPGGVPLMPQMDQCSVM